MRDRFFNVEIAGLPGLVVTVKASGAPEARRMLMDWSFYANHVSLTSRLLTSHDQEVKPGIFFRRDHAVYEVFLKMFNIPPFVPGSDA